MKMKRLCALALALILCLAMSGCTDLQQFLTGDQPSATATESATSTESAQTSPSPSQAGHSGTTELLPLNVLMNYPDYTAPQISADGSTVLYRDMTGNDVIIAEDWQTGRKTVVPWPAYGGVPRFIFWAPDSETVFFFMDKGGDENYGLYTTNVRTGDTMTITAGRRQQLLLRFGYTGP